MRNLLRCLPFEEGPKRCFVKVLVCMLVAAWSGCAAPPPPPGPAAWTSLMPAPTKSQQSIAADAWMDVVDISDPLEPEGGGSPSDASRNDLMRSNIGHYIEDGHFFHTVNMLPGSPKPDIIT